MSSFASVTEPSLNCADCTALFASSALPTESFTILLASTEFEASFANVTAPFCIAAVRTASDAISSCCTAVAHVSALPPPCFKKAPEAPPVADSFSALIAAFAISRVRTHPVKVSNASANCCPVTLLLMVASLFSNV